MQNMNWIFHSTNRWYRILHTILFAAQLCSVYVSIHPILRYDVDLCSQIVRVNCTWTLDGIFSIYFYSKHIWLTINEDIFHKFIYFCYISAVWIVLIECFDYYEKVTTAESNKKSLWT